jgi:prevent-host-death family protein
MEAIKPALSYGARDLRTHLREALDCTMRGQHVEITRHGRPEAYIVPADWHERATRALAATEQNE